jgi:hypothetical protein
VLNDHSSAVLLLGDLTVDRDVREVTSVSWGEEGHFQQSDDHTATSSTDHPRSIRRE